MDLIFIYGPPAAGKYTVAKILSDATGLPLFHNHLIVDAVHAVFAFGSPSFVRLREAFWIQTLRAACDEDRSLIFTFQPEASVSPGFAAEVADLVRESGGRIFFVHITVSRTEQEARIANVDRAKFGKMRDAQLLRSLQDQFAACEAAMPQPDLVIDTASVAPAAAAARIRDIL